MESIQCERTVFYVSPLCLKQEKWFQERVFTAKPRCGQAVCKLQAHPSSSPCPTLPLSPCTRTLPVLHHEAESLAHIFTSLVGKGIELIHVFTVEWYGLSKLNLTHSNTLVKPLAVLIGLCCALDQIILPSLKLILASKFVFQGQTATCLHEFDSPPNRGHGSSLKMNLRSLSLVVIVLEHYLSSINIWLCMNEH